MKVAKVVVFDASGKVLSLKRSGTHPVYPHDIDLPGGIVDGGETLEQAAVRELHEETGHALPEGALRLVRVERAHWGVVQHLFTAMLDACEPAVRISWEHESYEWKDRHILIAECASAADCYMNLAADYLREGNT